MNTENSPKSGRDNDHTSIKTQAVRDRLLIFVATIGILHAGKEVVIPILLALFLAFLLFPIVAKIRQLRCGRIPSSLLAIGVALGIFLAIGSVIGTQISDLSTHLPEYISTVKGKISVVRHLAEGRFGRLAGSIDLPGPAPAAPAPNGQSIQPNASLAPATTQPQSPLQLTQSYLSLILSPVGTFGIVFVVAFFALLEGERLSDRLVRLIGGNRQTKTTMDDASGRLSRYFLTQLCINTAFGVVIGIGLAIIGLPNPVLFGIISALMRFVPYIGAMISSLLPFGLALAVDPGWSSAVWTGCLYVSAEVFTGQFLEPMIYGHSTGLSPLAVVISAIAWTWILGPVGLILSTPLTLCLVVAGRHSSQLEFLDILLGDQSKDSAADAKTRGSKRSPAGK